MSEPIDTTGQPPLVVATCNQKGGVGKTTSTCHLARAASVAGLRVLVVDLDPQGNTTATLGPDDLTSGDVGVADAITPNSDVAFGDVLTPSIWPGVTLAPTPDTGALTEAEQRVEAMPVAREQVLAKALRPIVSDYDLVLIDTTPALGQLLILALAAAHRALIVTQPEQWSADGLAALHKTIDLVAENSNSQLRTLGPLINAKQRTNHHDQIVQEDIIPAYGEQAWAAAGEIIPQWIAIPDHLHAGMGLDQARSARDRGVAEVYTRFVRRMFAEGKEA